MKYKFIAVFSCLLLFSCFLLIPASAAEHSNLRYNGFSFPEIPSYDGVSVVFVDVTLVQSCLLAQFSFDSYVDLVADSVELISPNSIDIYVLVFDVWLFVESVPAYSFAESSYFLWSSSDVLNSSGTVYFPGSDPFFISPSSSPVFGDGLYFQAYQLLADHVFGLDLSEMTSSQELMVSITAGLAVLFLILVPFLIVWHVIRTFF